MQNPSILAVGADIKNRFLIGQGNQLLWGPPLGDLRQAENFISFEKSAARFLRDKKITPDIIAHDLHPGYFSTQFAFRKKFSNIRRIGVQHHHAHIASVVAEQGIKGPVIGVAFDGTGFGADGNIWGGEFLLVDGAQCGRLAHFKYQPMPGGERVVREPWRMVIAIMGKKGFEFARSKEKEKIFVMAQKGIQSPLSSSVGRIFDAAAALLGICSLAKHEAEGPVRLESLCRADVTAKYPFDERHENEQIIIDPLPVFLKMSQDLRCRKDVAVCATKFHNTIAAITVTMIQKLSRAEETKQVVLSGGVFQNNFLRKKIIQELIRFNFKVFTNEKFFVNDFNIALGQYHVSRCSWKN